MGSRRHHHRHHRRGDRCDRVAATPQPALHQHDDHRRRYGRGHRDAQVPRDPPEPRTHHRVGPGLVRRLPPLHLLLHDPRSLHCHRWLDHPLRHRLQARHGPRIGQPAHLRLGLWSVLPVAPTDPHDHGRGHPAVPLRLHVHHLRREPVLDTGRRIRLLVQPVHRHPVHRSLRLCGARGPPPGLGGVRACRLCHVPHRRGYVRARRGGHHHGGRAAPEHLGHPRRRHPAHRWRRHHRPQGPVVAHAVVGRVDRAGRSPAHRRLAGTVRSGARVLHLHGLHERRGVGPLLPRGRHMGAGPGRIGRHHGGAGAEPLRHLYHPPRHRLGSGHRYRPAGEPLQRPAAPTLVHLGVPHGGLGFRHRLYRCGHAVASLAAAPLGTNHCLAPVPGRCRVGFGTKRRGAGRRTGPARAVRRSPYAAPSTSAALEAGCRQRGHLGIAGHIAHRRAPVRPPAGRQRPRGALRPERGVQLVAVQLRRLRGTDLVSRVPLHHADHAVGGQEVRLWSSDVGIQREREPLRDSRGSHAPALLDQRVHRFHGGTALRVVGHDAVPLPQPGRAVRRALRARGRACPMARSTSRSVSNTSSSSA